MDLLVDTCCAMRFDWEPDLPYIIILILFDLIVLQYYQKSKKGDQKEKALKRNKASSS